MSYRRREVLDSGPVSRKVWHEIDRGESWAVETRQDCTEIVETNKAEYALQDLSTRWGPNGEVWARVARVPIVEWYAAAKRGEFSPNDDQSVLRWVSDRDRLGFRTRPGRLV